MLIGDIGAMLGKTVAELNQLTVDEFDFWSAYITVKHGSEQSTN